MWHIYSQKGGALVKNTRITIFMGLFIALQIILTRFLSIQTPIIRIGFSFLPLAISAMIFGPLIGGIGAAIADIVGMMLFPVGAYFPGFTVTAFVSGAIYGLFLFEKPKTLTRISISVIIVSLLADLGLSTIWLWMLTGKGFMALLPARSIKALIMLPIQIVMIRVIWKYVMGHIQRVA